MTIDEAIKVLKYLKGEGPLWTTYQCRQGLSLGIEALKRIGMCRDYGEIPTTNLLPGETE